MLASKSKRDHKNSIAGFNSITGIPLRAGRMRSESAFYAVLPSGSVRVFAPPPELAALMMPDALVGLLTRSRADKAAAAQEKQQHQQQKQPQKAAAKPEQQQQQQQGLPAAGGMRLELTKEVRGEKS